MTAVLPPFLDFINQLKSKAGSKQAVLFADGPITDQAESLAEPKDGFKPLDGSPRRVEGLEAAHLRHVLLHPEMIAFNPCCRIFVTWWVGFFRSKHSSSIKGA